MKLLLRILGWALAIVLAVAVGGWFALKRPDVPYETLEQKYAGADSRYADLGEGMRIRYVETGKADGPTIVLVHGFGVAIDTWRPWMAALAPDFRVIALDLPGHGLTRAPEGFEATPQSLAAVIERFAAKQKLERFTLVGQSLGGFAAWEYALAHPERLDGLVLLSASGWPDERPETRQRRDSLLMRAMRTDIGFRLLRDLDKRAMLRDGLIQSYENDALVTDAVVERYSEMARAPGHRHITMGMLADWDRWTFATPQRLAALRVPTLIMHGDKDLLVPVEDARRFDQTIPDSRLIVYQNAGHMLNEELAARSAADLKAFIGELGPDLAEAPPARTSEISESVLPPPSGPTDPSLIFE